MRRSYYFFRPGTVPSPQVPATLAPLRRYPRDIWSSSPLTHIDASPSGALPFPAQRPA